MILLNMRKCYHQEIFRKKIMRGKNIMRDLRAQEQFVDDLTEIEGMLWDFRLLHPEDKDIREIWALLYDKLKLEKDRENRILENTRS